MAHNTRHLPCVALLPIVVVTAPRVRRRKRILALDRSVRRNRSKKPFCLGPLRLRRLVKTRKVTRFTSPVWLVSLKNSLLIVLIQALKSPEYRQ